MNKIFHHVKKKELLIHIAELLFNLPKGTPTIKYTKVIILYGKLFQSVELDMRSKYIQGSLFAIGGILKVETKSFLRTLES